jgi:AraC-like DNA-binding protein
MKPGGDVSVEVGGITLVHHNYPGRVTRRYQPPEHLVLFPIAGEIEVGVGELSFSCGPGRLVYVPAGKAHSLRSAPRDGERLIALIRPETWARAGGGAHDPAASTASPVLREMLFFLLLHPQTEAAAALTAAFVRVLEEQLLEARSFPCLDHLEGRAKDPRLRAAVRFLRDHLGERVSMEDVARAAALSVRSLTRLFAAEFGLSPKEVLTKNRVAAARDLMAAEKLSVTEAASAVGYSSLSQFIKTFREVTGRLPSEVARSGR